MNHLGYEIKNGKHIAVRPKGTLKYFRLYKLTKDEKYSEENIKTRILENEYIHYQTIQKSKSPIRLRMNGNTHHQRKITGFKAMCIKYMYNMGIIPKNAPSKKKVHFLFKEELSKMDDFTKTVTFVFKKNINSFDTLNAYKLDLNNKRDYLIKERKKIYTAISRSSNPDSIKALENKKDILSSSIIELNQELKLCKKAEEKLILMESKLKLAKELEQEQQNKQKEKQNKRIH